MQVVAAVHVANNPQAVLSLEVTVPPSPLLCCCLSDPPQPTLRLV